MKTSRIFLTVAVSICISQDLAAQVRPAGQWGSIDWRQRIVIVTGIGAPPPDMPIAAARPNALRAASVVALRNAMETIKGVPLTSATTVSDNMVTSDAVTARVDGFLQGFRQSGKPKYMSDGTVEVTMEVPLDGALISEMLPAEVVDTPSTVTALNGKSKKPAFTGLIVDCADLDMNPALLPQIIDDQGNVVYSTSAISRRWATKWGSAGYATSHDSAKAQLERVGSEPLTVKAIKASGSTASDAVITTKEANFIRKNRANAIPLSECRVVFVVK